MSHITNQRPTHHKRHQRHHRHSVAPMVECRVLAASTVASTSQTQEHRLGWIQSQWLRFPHLGRRCRCHCTAVTPELGRLNNTPHAVTATLKKAGLSTQQPPTWRQQRCDGRQRRRRGACFGLHARRQLLHKLHRQVVATDVLAGTNPPPRHSRHNWQRQQR